MCVRTAHETCLNGCWKSILFIEPWLRLFVRLWNLNNVSKVAYERECEWSASRRNTFYQNDRNLTSFRFVYVSFEMKWLKYFPTAIYTEIRVQCKDNTHLWHEIEIQI